MGHGGGMPGIREHMFLRQNSTTKSHDHEKDRHFCNCRGIICGRGSQMSTPNYQASAFKMNEIERGHDKENIGHNVECQA